MKLRVALSNFFLFIGLTCLSISGVLFYLQNHIISPPKLIPIMHEAKIPVSMRISSIHIDLPIYESKVLNTHWETTAVGISYLETSPLPGSMGNSILYAHNWPNLFGKIKTLKPNDSIIITFSDNSITTFKVNQTHIVPSNDLSILQPTTFPQITLYTCEGLFDTNRTVVLARM